MNMRLLLVRHGETESNIKQLNAGQSSCQLSEQGLIQAELIGKRLKNEHLDIIFVSDLKRTIQTSEGIIKYHKDVEVIYDPRIREINFGEFEGTKYGSIKDYTNKNNLDFLSFKPKGGESINEFQKRINNFISWLKIHYKDKTVLLVTHGGLIIGTLLHLLTISQKEYKKYQPSNTALTELNINGDLVKAVKINCSLHLI